MNHLDFLQDLKDLDGRLLRDQKVSCEEIARKVDECEMLVSEPNARIGPLEREQLDYARDISTDNALKRAAVLAMLNAIEFSQFSTEEYSEALRHQKGEGVRRITE